MMLHSDDLPRIDFYIMINKISNYYLTCVCVLKIRFQTITSYVYVCVEKVKRREILSNPPKRDSIMLIVAWRFFVMSTSLTCSILVSANLMFVSWRSLWVPSSFFFVSSCFFSVSSCFFSVSSSFFYVTCYISMYSRL
jgi:hypothetical protein